MNIIFTNQYLFLNGTSTFLVECNKREINHKDTESVY
jgi:hypothetical protein